MSIVMIFAGFLLGACPFSVWIGRIALHTDIRQYGDGNPGTTNVFKAGSVKWGLVTLLLDIAKGMPAIILARTVLGLGQPELYIIAVAAVAGHAYSPFLGFKGGKAVAVFGGTLFALLQWDIVLIVVGLFGLGALIFINDAWAILVGIAGVVLYLLFIRADIWEFVYIGGTALIFVFKQYHDLKHVQHPSGRFIGWIRSRKKAA